MMSYPCEDLGLEGTANTKPEEGMSVACVKNRMNSGVRSDRYLEALVWPFSFLRVCGN